MTGVAEGAPTLRGERLTRSYAGRSVLEVDGFEVGPGEAVALLGPNGAGKSTLMRILAGLESPDTGRLLYKGRAVAPGDAELRRAVAAVMQRPYLWRGTVDDNVGFGLRIRGLAVAERRARVRDVLESLGIAELIGESVAALSGGEVKRVALARALALEPEILFLDEPTADLDVAVRRRLLADLDRIARETAGAIVLITHDAAEALALAGRVAVMEGGRVVQTGSPAEIFEAPATEFVASFTGVEFMLSGRIERSSEGLLIVRLDSGLVLEAAGHGRAGDWVRVGYRPEDVVLGPADAAPTSARNHFPARVTRAHDQGALVRLRLATETVELEAVITRHALEELGIEVGGSVVALIKATALHVFPA